MYVYVRLYNYSTTYLYDTYSFAVLYLSGDHRLTQWLYELPHRHFSGCPASSRYHSLGSGGKVSQYNATFVLVVPPSGLVSKLSYISNLQGFSGDLPNLLQEHLVNLPLNQDHAS